MDLHQHFLAMTKRPADSRVDSDGTEAIVNVATESSAELILMDASREKVVDEWLSAGVMQKCDVPVSVVPHCYGSKS